ncbi:MAG: RloB family protein [Candidatus Parabeggiatoa sp.]|nr:RloB family protein [Candidatus Parabeggiatoa sp.]
MGSDDLHKKTNSVKNRRKRKSKIIEPIENRQRQFGNKEIPKIFIISDDTKSIVYYLKGFQNANKINPKNLTIEGCGFDQFRLAEKAKEKAEDYDCVFCLFDQDAGHKSDPHYKKYRQALDLIKNYHNIAAITSVPCYEIWLLLHFKYIDKAFTNTENKSICNMVISELRTCDGMQDYEKKKGEGKADEKIYQKMKPYMETALQNAELLEKSNERNHTDNPSTKIHVLIKDLQRHFG